MNDKDPFERLAHTHRRIEERLRDLERAAADVSDQVRRADALDEVADVIGFFERAGARHHDDEEKSLFPRLRGLASLAAIVTALEEEHRRHDAALVRLVELVDGFPEEGPDADGEAELRAAAKALADVYRAHIAREERDLFPEAAKLVAAGEREAMAREMEQRRAGGGGRHKG